MGRIDKQTRQNRQSDRHTKSQTKQTERQVYKQTDKKQTENSKLTNKNANQIEPNLNFDPDHNLRQDPIPNLT